MDADALFETVIDALKDVRAVAAAECAEAAHLADEAARRGAYLMRVKALLARMEELAELLDEEEVTE